MAKQYKKQSKTRTRSALAEVLECSVSTIRKYEREFAKWMVTPPGVRGQGTTREYDTQDVTTLVAIHNLRQAGQSYDAIRHGLLDKALASGTVEFLAEDSPPEEEERGLVVVERQLAAAQGALRAIEQERDRLLADLKEERERANDAAKRAAAAGATQEERDRLLAEKERLQAKMDALEGEVARLAGLSWWEKLRGKK